MTARTAASAASPWRAATAARLIMRRSV